MSDAAVSTAVVAAPAAEAPVSGAPAAGTPAAEERGQLSVRAHALQRIVEKVALEVPRVRRTEGGLAGVRSGTPRASVSVRGTTARVSLDVACDWPAPVSAVAAEVRERVVERASELSGVRITAVDVTVTVKGIDERRTS